MLDRLEAILERMWDEFWSLAHAALITGIVVLLLTYLARMFDPLALVLVAMLYLSPVLFFYLWVKYYRERRRNRDHRRAEREAEEAKRNALLASTRFTK